MSYKYTYGEYEAAFRLFRLIGARVSPSESPWLPRVDELFAYRPSRDDLSYGIPRKDCCSASIERDSSFAMSF